MPLTERNSPTRARPFRPLPRPGQGRDPSARGRRTRRACLRGSGRQTCPFQRLPLRFPKRSESSPYPAAWSRKNAHRTIASFIGTVGCERAATHGCCRCPSGRRARASLRRGLEVVLQVVLADLGAEVDAGRGGEAVVEAGPDPGVGDVLEQVLGRC